MPEPNPIQPAGQYPLPGTAAAQGGGAKPPRSQEEIARARKRWNIAIIVTAAILLLLVLGLFFMWFLGGDSQGARSACTKASSDLTSQYDSLQETVEKGKKTLQETDATQLSDPKLLEDLKLLTQKASRVVKPQECGGADKETIAKRTSDMITLAEQLLTQQQKLESAISAVQEAINAKGLSEVSQTLEETVKQAEGLMQQAEEAEVDQSPRAALSAQVDDAKRLLDQVKSLKQVSDKKVSELNESMRAAIDRLNEDIDGIKDAIDKKKLEDAKKAAEEQLKQLEQQRLQEQQQRQSPNTQTPSNPGGNDSGRTPCNAGEFRTDEYGRTWRCMDVLDQETGRGTATWILEEP